MNRISRSSSSERIASVAGLHEEMFDACPRTGKQLLLCRSCYRATAVAGAATGRQSNSMYHDLSSHIVSVLVVNDNITTSHGIGGLRTADNCPHYRHLNRQLHMATDFHTSCSRPPQRVPSCKPIIGVEVLPTILAYLCP